MWTDTNSIRTTADCVGVCKAKDKVMAYVISKTRRSLRWCWNHGKSFDCNGKPVNMERLGSDINLEAICCVSEAFINKYGNAKVYFYRHIKDNK